MKTTYLVYKQVNGVLQLAAATQEEWDAILKENRQMPAEKRRRFIKDCFEDGDELDCMYIEVPISEHQAWNSRNTILQRKRKAGELYKQVSFDTGVPGTGIESLHECVPSHVDLEGSAVDHVLMEELRESLRRWKPLGRGAAGALSVREKALLHRRFVSEIWAQQPGGQKAQGGV